MIDLCKFCILGWNVLFSSVKWFPSSTPWRNSYCHHYPKVVWTILSDVIDRIELCKIILLTKDSCYSKLILLEKFIFFYKSYATNRSRFLQENLLIPTIIRTSFRIIRSLYWYTVIPGYVFHVILNDFYLLLLSLMRLILVVFRSILCH